jgi:starch-binding outer membrane protein SusE/F
MKSKLLLLVALFFTVFSSNAQINSVAVVGAGVGGWPTGAAGEVDAHQLTRVTPTGDDWIIENLVVTGPGIKIRANNAWTDAAGGGGNWGRPVSGSQWPTATADEGGGSGDINTGVVPGTYTLTFNTTTKVYNFGGGAPIPVVKLVGSAVANPAGETMTFLGSDIYELTLNLAVGNVKFNIDGSVVGGMTFPNGLATSPTESTPIATAKSYKVTYNNGTSEYTFVDGFVPHSVAIVGAGTTAGWPTGASGEVDALVLKNVDNLNLNYRISELVLTAGPVKLRQDNDWAVSWAGAFPTAASALGGGGDISVTPAGTYSLTLDRTTNTYNFFTPKIGIIGSAIGGWDTVNEVQMTTTDGITYTLLNQAFIGGDGCKFRLDQNWDKSWKGVFPSGTADTGPGANIIVTAGTYDVQFNRLTGAFIFASPGTLANNSFSTKTFSVSPNPTNDNWNFTSSKEAIVSIEVIDMLGKVVATSTTTNIDASSLNKGVYFAKITSVSATTTIKVVKN